MEDHDLKTAKNKKIPGGLSQQEYERSFDIKVSILQFSRSRVSSPAPFGLIRVVLSMVYAFNAKRSSLWGK